MKRVAAILIILFTTLSAGAQTLQQGRNYFNQGDYEKAKPIMLKYLKQQPNDANRNYWYGVCCMETGESYLALPYLEKAASKSILKAYMYMGYYYMEREDYQPAISAFEEYVSKISKDKQQHNEQTEARFTAMADSLKVLFRMVRNTNRVCFIDSFVVNKNDLFETYILGESAGTVMSSSDFFGDSSEGEIFLPETENQVYYCRMAADSLFHLYTRFKSFDNWDDETPLPGLESTGSVRYPFFMNDGVTIYFASDGDESMGGLDLYVSRFNTQTGRFLKPEHLGMPFNSEANDYLYVIDETNNLGWFATDRRQPEGYVCVYVFIPNDSRQIFNYEGGDTLAIHRAARLMSISETQTNMRDVRDARQRLTILTYDVAEKLEKGDFKFLIDDLTEYHELSDFKNSDAAQLFTRWQELKSKYHSDSGKLQQQRDEYYQATVQQRADMKDELLKLEEEVLDEERRIAQMENDIRTTEINYLNR
ncbi:MAG: tetratricopeptide repeat protein [Bacteroidaceae bacterium]|nr:tetratricopeptide repeat protein [Bacteroidaceae bacterium]